MSSGNVGVGADSVSTTPPTIDASPLGTGNLGINVGTEGGNCSLFASGGAHTVANPVIYTSATNTVILSITGSNNLTLSGPFTLSGADNTGNVNRTIQVNNTGLTTLAGVVGDAGLTCGLIKTGPDSLVLSATNTYTGPTTISAGTLLVNGKLDVGAVTTATTATLGGSGTILGPVTVQGGGILAPGTGAIGTLTINSNLTLAGNALFKVNKAVSPSNDVVAVSGTLTNSGTGTLTVTNLTGSLAVGDQFKLFSTALANGAALTVTGGGVNWTNKLAVDGSIAVLSVISTVATNSTNITFSANSGSLSLSWPVDHLGWSLQVQTNALSTGLGTNWVTVPGSSSVTATNFTINPANGSVFYRLIYTAP
jgi:autotransporter-associated beta strand protein